MFGARDERTYRSQMSRDHCPHDGRCSERPPSRSQRRVEDSRKRVRFFRNMCVPLRGTCVDGAQGNANLRNAQRAVNEHQPERLHRISCASPPRRPGSACDVAADAFHWKARYLVRLIVGGLGVVVDPSLVDEAVTRRRSEPGPSRGTDRRQATSVQGAVAGPARRRRRRAP